MFAFKRNYGILSISDIVHWNQSKNAWKSSLKFSFFRFSLFTAKYFESQDGFVSLTDIIVDFIYYTFCSNFRTEIKELIYVVIT